VIYVPPSSLPVAAVGIDVLCNRQDGVTDEILEEIRVALDTLGSHCEELGKVTILPVLGDGARDKEMKENEENRRKEWENRTGQEAGISPDLTYDDDDDDDDDAPKGNSKCKAQ
jgi:hypothetical protein